MSADANTSPSPESVAQQHSRDMTARAETVRKLLERAEATAGTPEGELCMVKARRMIAKWEIDEAMYSGPREVEETIDTMELAFTGIFAQMERNLTARIAARSNCKVVFYDPWRGESPKKYRVLVHGYTSDLNRVKLLDASLQLQCKTELNAWTREQKKTRWNDKPGFEKFKDRRQFIESFADGVSAKMSEAMRVARQDAAQTRVAESNGSETVEEASSSVEIALRSRKDNVRDWFDNQYGDRLRNVQQRHSSGSNSASASGFDAGRRADTGQTRVGGGRRAIGS